ncbi:MAG: nucleotidyltransferase domain-containing protein [Cyclobacteriaceae bacterium]|nr:nucleotidyltransferase domain-containing protein [Cyclobacteriaceae bacterium]
MMFGLPDEFLRTVMMFGETQASIEAIILFGSRATGNYRSGSDVDLILKGRNLGIDDVIQFEKQLEKLDSLNTFDILIFDRIASADLIRRIEKTGITLYSKTRETIHHS